MKGKKVGKRDEGFDGAFGDINWSPERKKKRNNIR